MNAAQIISKTHPALDRARGYGWSMRASTRRQARSVLPRKVLPKVTDRQVAREFAPVIKRIPAKKAANAADRSPDAVKWWRAAHSAPSVASLINMAREIPSVHDWLTSMIGDGEETDFDSERTINAALTARARELDRGRE